ncbi:hypothetical protein LTR15_010336 [Elasticomyces elasticus]|nr:hypothetical protein LTR15_010336 [Elasticomyces elasticus]
MAQPNRSPDRALGDLGSLPAELRNVIYELVMPTGQACQFGGAQRFLLERPPGLMFVSRVVRTETMMLYFSKLDWSVNIKHGAIPGKGYTLVTPGKKVKKLARFTFNDPWSGLSIKDKTKFLQQITIRRVSPGWPCIKFEVVPGAATGTATVVLRHGSDCPACDSAKWEGAAEKRREAWQVEVDQAAKKAAKLNAQTFPGNSYSQRAAAYGQQSYSQRMAAYAAYAQQYRPLSAQVAGGGNFEQLERQYKQDTDEHHASVGRFTEVLFTDTEINVAGFSVQDLRAIAWSIDGAMSDELKKQLALVGSLNRAWRTMYGEGPSE